MARTVVNVTASSTLDGRDLSADGTKLDGIETNATADQTAAEIKTLVEASSDIALGGNPTTTTQSSGDNSTRIATTAFVTAATSGLATDTNLANKAPINSPTFTGTPAAPTASSGTNTTQLATTAFVTTAVAGASVAGISSSADATAITIDSSENVGIGSSGNAKLQVFGPSASPSLSTYANSAAIISNNAGGYGMSFSVDGTGTGYIQAQNFTTSNAYNLSLNPVGGRVGIATTSPSTVLDIEGVWVNNQGLLALNATSGQYSGLTMQHSGTAKGYLYYDNTNDLLDVYSATVLRLIGGGAERMRITSGGNVGIGVNSPTATLDVNGTIKLDGNYPVGTGNVALGDAALASIASDGLNNVAIGRSALLACTTGDENTSVGRQALEDNTTGSWNTALGALALFQNTTANYNTSVGRANLYGNTTGESNTSTGYYGMYTNTTGTYNTSNGTSSLQNNTTGSYNTGIGSSALLYNTTGIYNTAVGYQSLLNQTTATHNIGMGYAAGYDITSGSGNVCLGNYAGANHTTGNYSTYVGYQAGYTTTTGLYNTYVGGYAGYSATTAQYSACVGYYSGFNLTTNGYHAMLGYYAGSNSTGTAYGNVCIGYNCQAGGTTQATGNQRHTSIVLGYNTLGVGSGYFCFGTGTGNSRVYNQFGANASWTRVSDQRYKTDIQDNTNCGLAFINDLRPVTFKWKPKSEIDNTLPDYDADATEPEYSPKMYGLIAQEVKQVLDNHNITDFGGWHKDEASSIEGISQEMFIYPLIKAVQELSAKVTALENGG